jgi:hypothetical protein
MGADDGPLVAGTKHELASQLRRLGAGELHWFADWPIATVPRVGAIVYTIWDREGRFIYVGMAGRGGPRSSKSSGPFGRLASHASGRRSGDQFCVYVCDRLVLPSLHNRLSEVADGTLSLDRETRAYIRDRLAFRFVEIADGTAALALERQVQRGEFAAGKPLLNPL